MAKDEDHSEAIEVVEIVENETEVAAEDAKQAAGGDSAAVSLTDTVSSAKGNMGDVLATLKAWSQTAGSTVGGVFSTVGAWKEEGDTILNA